MFWSEWAGNRICRRCKYNEQPVTIGGNFATISDYNGDTQLYMRADGDHRDNSIVKKELLPRLRADGWAPIMAFDGGGRR